MFATKTATPELIRMGSMRDMLRLPGPCVTVLLPPYHPGEPGGSPASLLRGHVQEAARQLAERGSSKSANSNLLQPLEELAQEAAFAAGSGWSQVIFRSPETLEHFYLAQPVPASLTISGCFTIRRVSAEFVSPRLFYILALAKSGVALVRCAGLHAEPVKLPHGVPETLEEALELEPPDHDLQNRSVIRGESTGAMHGVRFGTGSGRERQQAHLADYYKLVDRGIQEFLQEPEIPLVLAGVKEDVALFRSVSHNPRLIKGEIAGSLAVSADLTPVLQLAYALLREAAVERQAAALKDAHERVAPTRFSIHPDEIVHAAFAGRVAHLFLNQEAKRVDVFERGNYRSWGQEELLNLAAVQTVIHHGKYCELPPDAMPGGAAAAALMRY